MKELTLIVPCHTQFANHKQMIDKFSPYTKYFKEILICFNGPGNPLPPEGNSGLVKFFHTPLLGIGHGYELGIKNATSQNVLLSAADLPFGLSDFNSWKSANFPDFAIGSKLHPNSLLKNRSLIRQFITILFYFMRKILFKLQLPKDTQGTIFLKRDVALNILPAVEGRDFFFSVELITRLTYQGHVFTELPIEYIPNSDKSTVSIIKDSIIFLVKIIKLAKSMSRINVIKSFNELQ